jgi:transmembrane sensor
MDHKLYTAEDFAADETFIAYYLSKDEHSVAFWTNWIAEHPEKVEEVLEAKQLLNVLQLIPTVQEQETAFLRFDQFLAAQPQEEKLPVAALGAGTKPKFFSFRIAAVAASMILMLTIGRLYVSVHSKAKDKIEYVSIHNDYGKIKTLSLADGTMVFLNANSSLTYPKHFENNRRDVFLTGEAYFEVAKDKTRPFTVNANGTKTRVLGTRFNINAYQKQKTVVALLEGSVAFESGYHNVQSANQSSSGSSHAAAFGRVILKPSEMVSYTTQDHHMKVSAIGSRNLTAWTSGTVIFSQASFAEISTTFRNLYGIELRDHTSAQEWRYSGRFTKSDYLKIIKSICFTKNLSYQESNHIITLTNK